MTDKRLLYITTWDFTNAEADGVCKKILSQIKVFKKAFYVVDYTYIKHGKTFINIDNKEVLLGYNHHLSKFAAHKLIAEYLKDDNDYKYVYIRYNKADYGFINLLSILNEHFSKIVVEIPTYPYDNECRSLRDRVILVIDKLFRGKIKKYISTFVNYYSDEPTIFGAKSIRISNGIDVDSIRIVNAEAANNTVIDLIGVAAFRPSHGYDRLIKSIGEYYKTGGNRDLIFHIVGYGMLEKKYRKLIKQYDIQNHVILYGKMYGDKLDRLYDQMDIGVCTLAYYRVANGMISNELKSREYASKGLPMISGGPIDEFNHNKYRYSLELGDNESIIDINRIIDFYDRVYSMDRLDVIAHIRKYAEIHCGMDVAMEPIILEYHDC